MAFSFFKKKPKDDEFALPPLPDSGSDFELPPLPPLPGEESEDEPQARMQTPPKWQKAKQSSPIEDFGQSDLPPAYATHNLPPQSSNPATVFVRIDKYKDIMSTVEAMQSKMEELKSTLDSISAIKGKEAEIVEGWNAMLQETKAKIDEVNARLTRPQE